VNFTLLGLEEKHVKKKTLLKEKKTKELILMFIFEILYNIIHICGGDLVG